MNTLKVLVVGLEELETPLSVTSACYKQSTETTFSIFHPLCGRAFEKTLLDAVSSY
jgi:hypothetical protein